MSFKEEMASQRSMAFMKGVQTGRKDLRTTQARFMLQVTVGSDLPISIP